MEFRHLSVHLLFRLEFIGGRQISASKVVLHRLRNVLKLSVEV